MANWCSNRVAFYGDVEAVRQIKVVFQTMLDKHRKSGVGQIPDFLNKENGYFFDIYWNEEDDGIFEYETRWSPNTEIVREIADHFCVGFLHEYSETGCLLYGRTVYKDGILTDTYLEWDDFDAYHFDDERDVYHFEGEDYESDLEILEILLVRKIHEDNSKTDNHEST
jgi:hypothetical protein